MTLVVISSIFGFSLLLWIFSRFAWGGGMVKPSYDLLRPTLDMQKLAEFAEPERETIEIHCAQCTYHRDLPETAQVSASLAHFAATQGGVQEGFAACAQCGGTLKSWLRRDIIHNSGEQTLVFSLLRRGAKRRIEVDGVMYEHLHDVPQPAQTIIADAIHDTEEFA